MTATTAAATATGVAASIKGSSHGSDGAASGGRVSVGTGSIGAAKEKLGGFGGCGT